MNWFICIKLWHKCKEHTFFLKFTLCRCFALTRDKYLINSRLVTSQPTSLHFKFSQALWTLSWHSNQDPVFCGRLSTKHTKCVISIVFLIMSLCRLSWPSRWFGVVRMFQEFRISLTLYEYFVRFLSSHQFLKWRASVVFLLQTFPAVEPLQPVSSLEAEKCLLLTCFCSLFEICMKGQEILLNI